MHDGDILAPDIIHHHLSYFGLQAAVPEEHAERQHRGERQGMMPPAGIEVHGPCADGLLRAGGVRRGIPHSHRGAALYVARPAAAGQAADARSRASAAG